MVNYFVENYLDSGLFIIVEQDCKNCVDFTKTFTDIYTKTTGKPSPKLVTFLGENVEKIPSSELLKGYKPGQAILLPNTSYASGVLMSRIANHLKKSEELVFLGGDGWGSWTAGYVGKLKSSYPYKGIRMSPWSIEAKTPEYMAFEKEFRKHKKKSPEDNISYISYQTLLSAVEAYKQYANREKPPREAFIDAFLKARKQVQHWFRPTQYGVYALNQKGEKFMGTISALPGKVSK